MKKIIRLFRIFLGIKKTPIKKNAAYNAMFQAYRQGYFNGNWNARFKKGDPVLESHLEADFSDWIKNSKKHVDIKL